MTEIMWNFLWANGLFIVLFLVFLAIKRQLSFTGQRMVLLAVPLIVVGAVLIGSWLSSQNWGVTVPVVTLNTVDVGAVTVGDELGSHFAGTDFSVWEMMYLAGVVLFFAWLVFRVIRILMIFSKANTWKTEGYTVAQQPGLDSFSFFNLIQLRADLNEADREIVFQHEKIHARKRHSLDVLYVELLQCIVWFNPFIFLMKKELIHIHEFEVDQEMYSKYKVNYMEFLLAYALGTSSSSYLLTNQFLTQLTLIKRIRIMKQTSKNRWVAALSLPLVAGTLSLISWTVEPQITAPVKKQVSAQVSQTGEVDKMPEFKGGMEALVNYMTTNVKYPESAAKANITGKVMVGFVVTETGKITSVNIKRGVNAELDAEAKRVVSAMPEWIPGEANGKKVSTEMVLPVNFQL